MARAGHQARIFGPHTHGSDPQARASTRVVIVYELYSPASDESLRYFFGLEPCGIGG